MSSQSLKNSISGCLAVASLVFLTACEPPTPTSLEKPIPQYTRLLNTSQWYSRIATLNVWGLSVISQHKKERLPAIGKAIAKKDLDVVLLQEAWRTEGGEDIHKNSRKKYDHHIKFKNTLGSGLMFLSDFIMTRNSFRPFQMFGPVLLPDAWAIKGVGMITNEVRGLPVSFYSTHLMAGLPRGEKTTSPFTPEWKMEMFEVIAHVIEQTDSDAFVIGGDFNIKFGDEEYYFWKKLTSLEGTYLEETLGLCTWCKDNTYAAGSDKQIDYIFVSPRLNLENVWVDFKEKVEIKGKMYSLSDHYGLVAELSAKQGPAGFDADLVRQNFREALAELRADLENYPNKQEEVQTQGLKERICLKCRIETSLQMIAVYEEALDYDSNLSPAAQRIRMRLDSYFSLFR